MASTTSILISPSELAYLHASLSLTPPLRPDGRAPTQFRPLMAETEVLPGTNGSARICFADGTEAIVGVKAEVEMQKRPHGGESAHNSTKHPGATATTDTDPGAVGADDWVEMTVEIPGCRDDEPSTLFLAAMLSEALLADGAFTPRLWINARFHWKLYLDILLISPPLSYPLPLLSLTTHLALLATRLPKLVSEGDEDPLFDDDWAAATYLYPRSEANSSGASASALSRPPVTLLVMAVGPNIIFDPAREELAVADAALAVSVGETAAAWPTVQRAQPRERNVRLLSVRTIDPPSRLTSPGVSNAANAAYGTMGIQQKQPEAGATETDRVEGVWKAPRGGASIAVMADLVGKVLEPGGIAREVLDALEAVELG